MYLTPQELTQVLAGLKAHFKNLCLLMDCYTEFAAKASKVKNPIQDVGVTRVYGLDEPKKLENSGLQFAGELEMTPEDLVKELRGSEKRIFQTLFAGAFAKKMYKLYEYKHGGT